MKKIILLTVLLNGLFSPAQILNSSFENVTGTKPDDWNTAANGYNSYFIRDTSIAQAGLHAAYIKGFGAQSYSIQGAVLGTFTVNARPVSLTGWYKSNIVPGDSLVFYVNMHQASDLTGAVANGFAFTQTTTSTYKQFTATINYSGFPVGNAGSTYIGIYFSGSNVDGQGFTIPQTGTWAMIDNLTLVDPTPPTNTFVSVGENTMNVNVEKVYPQPASGMVFLIYTISENSTCELSLFDITGREVKTIIAAEKQTSGRYKAEIDISHLNTGVYFTKLKVGNDIRVSKIIKQ